jgi:hypothetical protein
LGGVGAGFSRALPPKKRHLTAILLRNFLQCTAHGVSMKAGVYEL